MNKKIFKKKWFYAFAIVLITALILLTQYTSPLCYDTEYECVQNYTLTNIVIFHENGVVEIYQHDDPYSKRKFANYATDGDFVYIYNYEQKDYGHGYYSSKMIIKNRFNLLQESYNGDIKITAVQPMFALLIIVNAISLLVGIVSVVNEFKKTSVDKKEKIEESKEIVE